MVDKQVKEISNEILTDSKILIIDDDRTQLMLLRQIFEDLGFTSIHEARNGKEGWEKTLEIDPDLVLLDINMPVMDGFRYCRLARGNPDYKDMSIIVQTGLTDEGTKEKIFSSGATDYVIKPTDINEIIPRSFVHLERAQYVKELKFFKTRVGEELESARHLIELMLPKLDDIQNLKAKYDIDLAWRFQSSQEMGGDFWGIEPLDKDKVAVYCLDFSGHGLGSALNAVRVHSILNTNKHELNVPSNRLMYWLNNRLMELLPRGNFATMFYGVIDIEKNTLQYSTASSTNPVLIRKGEKKPTILSGKGYPLGAIFEAEFELKTIEFNKGDTLILYSDALTEARMQDGEILGEERLFKLFEIYSMQNYGGTLEAIDMMMQQFYKKCGRDLADDLTINIYHRAV